MSYTYDENVIAAVRESNRLSNTRSLNIALIIVIIAIVIAVIIYYLFKLRADAATAAANKAV